MLKHLFRISGRLPPTKKSAGNRYLILTYTFVISRVITHTTKTVEHVEEVAESDLFGDFTSTFELFTASDEIDGLPHNNESYLSDFFLTGHDYG